MIPRLARHGLVLLAATGLGGATSAANPGAGGEIVTAGRRVFRSQCSSCHALDGNRTGPRLRGVVGRAAGSVGDYRYSPALARADLVWDEAALDRWLRGPARFIEGVRMDARLPDRAERNAVIAYLRAMALAGN